MTTEESPPKYSEAIDNSSTQHKENLTSLENNEEELATLDKILNEYVGGAGKYQLFNTIVMAWVYYAGLYALFVTNFAAYEPPHRCRVDQCDELEFANQSTNVRVTTDILDADWLNFTTPLEESADNFFAQKGSYDKCRIYAEKEKSPSIIPNLNVDSCSSENFSENKTTTCNDGYIYSNYYFDETLSTKLNLVCDRKYLKTLLDTILIIGLLFGSLMGGAIGDKIGRKKACFGAIMTIVPVTICAGFVKSYYVYAVLHFITMTCLPVIWVNTYVYSTELFTPQWRYIFIGLFEIPIGYYIFNLIAYLNRTWTGIHIWVGVVTGLILPMYFLIPESVRWLAQNSKEDEAMDALLRIAKINGKNLSTDDKTKIASMVKEIANDSQATEDRLTPIDMFRKGHLSKTLILIFGWITSCISFYALGLNSTDLSGDIMLNFFLTRTSGFGVAVGIILIANNWGRVKSLVLSHTLLGISCICLAFIPKTSINAILVVYIFANIVASISFNLVYLMTCEMYPTNLRSQAVGTASSISRIFCALAPFLKPLAQIYQPLPMLVIGVPILISGALATKLPETFKKELPQTMKTAKELKVDSR